MSHGKACAVFVVVGVGSFDASENSGCISDISYCIREGVFLFLNGIHIVFAIGGFY